MSILRTAQTWGERPCAVVGLPWGQRKRLSETDAGLLYAFSIYEASLCKCGCGQWAEQAHDPDTDGWWEVDDSTVCYAGAASEEWRKENGENAEPGQLIHVVLSSDYEPSREVP